MAYEYEEIRKSQEIFSFLLARHELKEEDDSELYRAYTENEQVMNLVKSQGHAADSLIERYGSVIYLIPREDNAVLGFSKNQLKLAVCRSNATDKDYYLSQFVILTILVEFYDGQGNTSKSRDFMKAGELLNVISERLKEGAAYAEEAEENDETAEIRESEADTVISVAKSAGQQADTVISVAKSAGQQAGTVISVAKSAGQQAGTVISAEKNAGQQADTVISAAKTAGQPADSRGGLAFSNMLEAYEALRSDDKSTRARTTKEGFLRSILLFLQRQGLIDYVEADEMLIPTKKLDNFMDWNLLNQNHYRRVLRVLGENTEETK